MIELKDIDWQSILMIIIIICAIIIIIRKGILWYWKVDKLIELQEEQLIQLKRLVEISITWKCIKCDHRNPNNTYECEKCSYSMK